MARLKPPKRESQFLEDGILEGATSLNQSSHDEHLEPLIAPESAPKTLKAKFVL